MTDKRTRINNNLKKTNADACPNAINNTVQSCRSSMVVVNEAFLCTQMSFASALEMAFVGTGKAYFVEYGLNRD